MTKFFVIAGEASGDQLGGRLLRALKALVPDARFAGVGGAHMRREGLESLFSLSDIEVMGIAPLLRLPKLIARLRETVAAIRADPPDCLVLIDAPDFTHRVARRIRATMPEVPIVDYVSPSVWAWRPGRAKRMRAYIDLVLAILPFEPKVYETLSGPPCAYVGHPLIEVLASLQSPTEKSRVKDLLLILPGSREAEIERMLPVYRETAQILAARRPQLVFAIPVAAGREGCIRSAVERWSLPVQLLSQSEKFAAFRTARAALVTSGTASLELALAQTPMVVAYKVSRAESYLKFLVTAPYFALPNLLLNRRSVPELLQEKASPEALANALDALLDDGPLREAQLEDLAEIRRRMLIESENPSALAARLILGSISAAKGRGERPMAPARKGLGSRQNFE